MKILLVEDEVKVAAFIKKGLEEEYFSVDAAYEGKTALNRSFTEEYDLMIIDIMIPGIDGITLLKEIRKNKIVTPVLLLTAKSQLEDKVEGLDSGADDYLTKPFAFEELLARIRALLRRNESNKPLILKAEDLTVDLQSHKVIRDNREIILTPKEYSILEFLLRNKNQVVSGQD